ncbi:MAG: sugar phosphate nucleotidyltransferase [Acidimicrobiales bacterium]
MAETKIPTIILCGGKGTRMSGYDPTIPKPMVPIGGRPILWHIMHIYSAFGYSDFCLALGWLGDVIRRYVVDFMALNHDFTVDLSRPDRLDILGPSGCYDWRITCRETGWDALTGNRVAQVARQLGADRFMVTYGDCVGDIDVTALVEHHVKHGRLATVTAVRPPSRFGELILGPGEEVRRFEEKPLTSTGAINGGFMVFEAEALEMFPADGDFMLEREPLSALANAGQLTAYVHDGFWQPMDTPRERELLENLWDSGAPPWRVWSQ